jgi:hypothetical protein
MIFGNSQLMKASVPTGPIEIVSYSVLSATPYPVECWIAYPPNIVNGDLILLFIADANDTSTDSWNEANMDDTAGWVKIQGYASSVYDTGMAIFYRIADSNESNRYLTITPTGQYEMTAYLVHVKNASPTDPISTVGTVEKAGSNTITPTGYTGVVGDMSFVLGSFDGGDGHSLTVTGTGWTLLSANRSGTSSISSTSNCVGSILHTGTAGVNVTLGASVSDGFVGIQIRIKK